MLPTPFRPSLEVELEGLARLVGLYDRAGVAGFVALGVFGEASALSSEERRELVAAVAGTCEARRLVVGLTALDTRAACAEADDARQAGGSALRAVMVQVGTPSPESVIAHMRAVHEAAGVPVVLQHYPIVSGVHLSPEAVVSIVAASPFVAAVKWEAPPTSLAIAKLARELDVPVFGGLGGIGLLDELLAGAAGAMTGFSYPEALVEAVASFRKGGYAAARAALAAWLPFINFEAQAEVGLAIRKENLRRRGVIASAVVRPPSRPLPALLVPIVEQHQGDLAGLLT